MFDRTIRGGRVVLGSGQAGFAGDISIKNGRIGAVGAILGASTRNVDAGNAVVGPPRILSSARALIGALRGTQHSAQPD